MPAMNFGLGFSSAFATVQSLPKWRALIGIISSQASGELFV